MHWIRVEKALPPTGKVVLIYRQSGHVIASLDATGNWRSRGNKHDVLDAATHWVYLDKPNEAE